MARTNQTFYLDLSKRPGDKDSVHGSDWYVMQYDRLTEENNKLRIQVKGLKKRNRELGMELKKMKDLTSLLSPVAGIRVRLGDDCNNCDMTEKANVVS